MSFGLNCGLGPKEMAPVFQALWEDTSTPLLLQPNAWACRAARGQSGVRCEPADYARQMRPLAPHGHPFGGVLWDHPRPPAGADPGHPGHSAAGDSPAGYPADLLLLSGGGPGRWDPVIMGERINPTGRKNSKPPCRGDMGVCIGGGLPAGGGRRPHFWTSMWACPAWMSRRCSPRRWRPSRR